MNLFPLVRILIPALAALLLAAGCASTDNPSRRGGALAAMAGDTEEDRAITAQVRAALSSGSGFRYPDVRVRTSDGRVELSGAVPREEQREYAEAIAQDVHGVHSVINLITVRETARSITPRVSQPGGGRGWGDEPLQQ